MVPTVVLFFADQLTKLLIDNAMVLGVSRPVFGNVVRLSYVRNSGAAFGILSGSKFPFVYVSAAAIALMIAYFFRRVKHSTLRVVSLGLITGGAIGNLFDRARFGEVIDFVDVGWGQWRWPVFNVADAGVTVGFILLILSLSFASSHHEADRVTPDSQAPGTP